MAARPPHAGAGHSSSSSPDSTLQLIERELAALQEAKVMNAHALRSAILEGQVRKADRRATSPARAAAGGALAPGLLLQGEARVAWERAVIEDELSRPLEVSAEFVQELAQREAETEQRLLRGLSKHQASLQSMRARLLERETEAEKTYAYKTAREVLGPRPDTLEDYQASLLGTALGSSMLAAGEMRGDAVDAAAAASMGGTRRSPSRRSQHSGGGAGSNGGGGTGGVGGSSSTGASNATSGGTTAALSHFTMAEGRVLDSLARLEQLEQRIADLESRTSGTDLAELLGISLPPAGPGGDGGTGGSSALRSAYAPVPLAGSASTRSARLPAGGGAGAAGSVFSTGSRAGAPGGVPRVGFAPALGTVYTRKRLASSNPTEPSRTVYLLERIEDATARRGIAMTATGLPARPSFEYDADAAAGDTGGSQNPHMQAQMQGQERRFDGDDTLAAIEAAALVSQVPVETSDAIDRWLATKQRQVASTLQVRAAEGAMKTSLLQHKAAALGARAGAPPARGGGAAAGARQQAFRGRQVAAVAAPTAAAGSQRMAQSMGPAMGARGRPLARAAPPAVKGGPGADTHRRMARTVAVGSQISKVLQDERNRQAARSRLTKAPPANVKTERASARSTTKRAALAHFSDIRKKFEAQKSAAGAPSPARPAPAASPARPPARSLSHPRADAGARPVALQPSRTGQIAPAAAAAAARSAALKVHNANSAAVAATAPAAAAAAVSASAAPRGRAGAPTGALTHPTPARASAAPAPKLGVLGPVQQLNLAALGGPGFSRTATAAAAQLPAASRANGAPPGGAARKAPMAGSARTAAGAAVAPAASSTQHASVASATAAQKAARANFATATGGVRVEVLESLQLRGDERLSGGATTARK